METLDLDSLFNLINYQSDINKIYLYAKVTYEAKYHFLINKWASTGLKYLNDSKAFIKYSNFMYDIYKNIEEYNPNTKREILTVFDDMIADMLSKKQLNPIVTRLFIKCRKQVETFLLFLLHNLISLFQKILD